MLPIYLMVLKVLVMQLARCSIEADVAVNEASLDSNALLPPPLPSLIPSDSTLETLLKANLRRVL